MIVENRAYTDATELARQLGAMPPQGSFGEKAMLGMVNARTGAVGLVKRAARARLAQRLLHPQLGLHAQERCLPSRVEHHIT